MAGSSIMESLFQRTLDDIIKGFRLNLSSESSFISKALEEIRREIKSTDPDTKAIALQKLTYLHSIHGIDMSWAAFQVVEVLSFPRFAHKKIGYLAASLSFSKSTEVILLMTNQLRKDLTSTNQFEVSLALEFLSNGCNTDLARDLTPEIFTLLSSSKISVRKKAITSLLRVFAQYPDSVKVCLKRLVENLDSSDSSVLSVTVGVFCELIERDPSSYLPLAPEFYRILVDSRNNWVLIKVVKIFSKFVPIEPRLGKKVVDSICDLVRRTSAKSLMFECIQAIVTCLDEFETALKLAIAKIRELLVDDDSNLRYMGLKALARVGHKHAWAILENKEAVIKSLSDEDPNIKIEALYLVMSMVSENNVVEISRVLISYASKSDPEFCNKILYCILATCGRNLYEVVVDFDWYVSLLCEMPGVPHFRMGEEVENQIIDISTRVSDARPQLVRICRDLLIDPALLGNPLLHRVLSASALVSGQYIEFSTDPIELVEALAQPRTSLLPPSIRAVYVHSLFKVLLFCLYSYIATTPLLVITELTSEMTLREAQTDSMDNEKCDLITNVHGDVPIFSPSKGSCFSHNDIVNMVNVIEAALLPLLESNLVEVSERARNVFGFIMIIKESIPGCFSSSHDDDDAKRDELRRSKIIQFTYDAFSTELGPISMAAQERVPLPDGLSLNENLHELDLICKDVVSSPSSSTILPDIDDSAKPHESSSLLKQHRKRYQLYYLSTEKNDDHRPTNDHGLHDDSQSLARLAEQSIVSMSKPHRSKPRPVVVKLDEVDFGVKETGLAGGDISGVVRDALGRWDSADVSGANPSKKSYKDGKGKEKLGVDVSLSRDRSLRSKHRKIRTSKIRETAEASGERSRTNGRHRHGRCKNGDKVEPSANVGIETTAIPDFLL